MATQPQGGVTQDQAVNLAKALGANSQQLSNFQSYIQPYFQNSSDGSQQQGTAQVPGTPQAANPTQPPATAPATIATNQPSPASANATPYTGAATQINISQPNQQAPAAVPTASVPPVQPASNIQSQSSTNKPIPGLDYNKVYQAASKSLKENQNVPQSGGAAASTVQNAVSSNTPTSVQSQTTPNVDTFFSTNPGVTQMSQNLMDFLSPQSTRDALVGQMQTILSQQNTLSQERLQYMDINRIMAGSVYDIRDEINKAGGTATESQVQAMAVARNSQLIRQAGFLQDQMQYQQSLISNSQSLLSFEKDLANQQFTQRMGILQYQQTNNQNMLNAYRQSYNTLLSQYGAAGLYNMFKNDPQQMQYASSIMGIDLKGFANAPQSIELQLKQSELAKNIAMARLYGGFGSGTTTTGQPNVSLDANGNPVVMGTNTSTGATYDQHGLLSATNFSPNSQLDQNAKLYLQQYLNGTEPSARGLGITGPMAQAGGFNTVATRAQNLFYQATGKNLQPVEYYKSQVGLLDNNNKLANNLKLQEQTVKQNVDLSLANMNKNGLNSSGFKPLDNLIDYVRGQFQDPAVNQMIAQNVTLQNELGSLLSVKNSSGTTVYDKLESAHIISNNDSPQVIQQKINSLMQEAENFANAINSVNGQIYSNIDPLQWNSSNPARQAYGNIKNTGNNASGDINKGNTTINGLTATIQGKGRMTFKSQEDMNKFIKDHNLQ